MFRCPDGAGLGNLFIWLSQLDESVPVSSQIYDGYRGKYLEFSNLNIVEDDPTIENLPIPDIYINQFTNNFVHPKCKEKVKPSKHLFDILEQNKHLVSDVSCGIAIRTYDPHCGKIADESTLAYFDDVINSSKKVFIACDNLEYKLKLNEKYPNKINFLNHECVHVNNNTTTDSPTPFLEFFLLSMCPFIYLTGGSTDMTMFSTFGYMASVYGNIDKFICWNKS